MPDSCRPSPVLSSCAPDPLLGAEGILFRWALRGLRRRMAAEPEGALRSVAARIEAPARGLLLLSCGDGLARRLGHGGAAELLRSLLGALAQGQGADGASTAVLEPGPGLRPARDPDRARVLRVGAGALELEFWRET